MARGDDSTVETRGLNGRLIGAAALAVLLAVVIFQNTDSTDVTLLFWEVSFPLWLVLLGTAVVTLVAAELVGAVRRRRRS
ncbi:MAG TPA: LapA family protein [Acidimicrobiales bacterium]|nr:LapA family protein [Acidimicrobiales bacterium]